MTIYVLLLRMNLGKDLGKVYAFNNVKINM